MYQVKLKSTTLVTTALLADAQDFAIRQMLGGHTRALWLYKGTKVVCRYMWQKKDLYRVAADKTFRVDTASWIAEREAVCAEMRARIQ